MTKALAAAALALALLPTTQANIPAPVKFTAFAVDISNTTPRPITTPFDMTINRWSTDAERDQLKNILKERGQDALLSALQKLPVVGYVNTPGSLRYDLHFARQRAFGATGHTILLMTDRPMSAWEAWHQPRTVQYPFTLIQLQVDQNGNGVGKASVATRITEDEDGTVELENFSSSPVILNEVRETK
ncbi:MAG TPA: hypothetical protein VGL62_12275 [Vicinamibacterales bacterium]|jgi:hypothetical protein